MNELYCPYCGRQIPKFDKYGKALRRSKRLELKTCGGSDCLSASKMTNRRSGPAKLKPAAPLEVRDYFNLAHTLDIEPNPRDWETAEASDAARSRFRRA